ncbi:MAG: DUF4258 domain-containing protein [Patescibacteria group bacterium]
MPNYQDFAKKARERFQKSQDQKKKSVGGYELTRHAEYKMQQYGLSLQKIKGVIRNPKRIEKGVAEKTIAVMQPVSPKKELGKSEETWKQEVWVMYQKKSKNQKLASALGNKMNLELETIRIISAWRYPGISPKNNPIPSEILLELEDELA